MLVEDMIDLKPTSLVTLTPEMKLQQVCGVIRKNSWITLFPVLRADGVVSYFIHSKIIENLTEWPAPEACVDVNLQQEVARGQENAMQLLNRFAHSDHIYVEVLNPETGEEVAEGERGELVITSLKKKARPLIRFRTGDIVYYTTEPNHW